MAQTTDQLILVLRLGSHASADVSGAFSYSVLNAKATVEAGGDVGYSYFRALSASTPALQLITGFFRDLRLPSHISQPLQAGEVIVFQYGGYLKFGADLSVGYEMKGTPTFDLGDLQSVRTLPVECHRKAGSERQSRRPLCRGGARLQPIPGGFG